jgi:hypothetical protein
MKKIVLLSDSKLLSSDQNANDIKFVSGLAAQSHFEFVHLANFELESLAPMLPELAGLFINSISDEHLAKFKEHFEEKILKNFVHAIIDPDNLSLLPIVLSPANVGHIVVRRYDSYDQEMRLYSRIISSTQQERASDLQSIFPTAKLVDMKLTKVTQRDDAIQMVLQKLVNFGASKSITQSIVTAVDELLINALHDSKIDTRQPSTKAMPTSDTVNDLIGRAVVDIQCTIDDSYFGVAVTDHMGSLDHAKLFGRIARSYSGLQTIDISLSKSGAGAGVGLSMVLRSGGSLFLSCRPGEKTTATVIFKITDRMLDFKKQFQFMSTQFDA